MLMFPPETPSTIAREEDDGDRSHRQPDGDIRREPEHRPTDRRTDLADDQHHLAADAVGDVPQSGAETNWQNENVAMSRPTTNGDTPKCVTKYGSIGISMLKPTMSMNVMPRIGRSLRIMLADVIRRPLARRLYGQNDA